MLVKKNYKCPGSPQHTCTHWEWEEADMTQNRTAPTADSDLIPLATSCQCAPGGDVTMPCLGGDVNDRPRWIHADTTKGSELFPLEEIRSIGIYSPPSVGLPIGRGTLANPHLPATGKVAIIGALKGVIVPAILTEPVESDSDDAANLPLLMEKLVLEIGWGTDPVIPMSTIYDMVREARREV